MLKFYYSRAPSPMKVVLFLEKAALPYAPIQAMFSQNERLKSPSA